MSRFHDYPERHASARIGWLRAAVLGANDGIVSTANLIIGVAAANAGRQSVPVARVAASNIRIVALERMLRLAA